MSEEIGKLQCASCGEYIEGLPTEMREPINRTGRETRYFCSRICMFLWLSNVFRTVRNDRKTETGEGLKVEAFLWGEWYKKYKEAM